MNPSHLRVRQQRGSRGLDRPASCQATRMAAVLLYSMMGSCIILTKSIRATLPSLVPLIAKQQNLLESQQALLMSSFFPGCKSNIIYLRIHILCAFTHCKLSDLLLADMITQIPAGYLAQRFGPKLVLLVNLSGTACCFGLLPAAVRSSSGSVWLPATLLCVMGLCQGSLIPGMQPQNFLHLMQLFFHELV